MNDRNPYASPRAKVVDSDGDQEYGEIALFTARGRLGRVRYIGYTVALTVLAGIVFGAATAAAGPEVAAAVVIAGYAAVFVISLLWTIQRAHDFDTSGWLSILMFVPLVNMLFWFVPGTAGENRFGKRTPPNTIGVILLACILPVVFVLGILAAIAIPAYQDYTLRAQVSEGLMLASPVKAAIERSYRQTGAAPLDRAAVGLPADASGATGKYVESVDVVDGTILVTYGLEANARLAGRAVALQPYVGPGDSIVWRCGAAPVAGGTVPMAPDAPGADFATEIEPQLLPSGCRP